MTAFAVPADRRATTEVETSPDALPRLAHQPALDGLRGLAVGAVWIYHLERLEGGFLGVDLFFVLSGFLITSLLLAEHQARGGIDLRGFWARRARRLLPALLVLLAGTSLLLFLTPWVPRHAFRGDALAALGYAANWYFISFGGDYWQPALLPTWSLAIEEQFYVAWPLLVLLAFGGAHLFTRRGRRRRGAGAAPEALRRRLGWWALAGAAASFGLMAWLHTPKVTDLSRAYYGTDTRLGAILLGSALAAFTWSRRPLASGGAALSNEAGELPRTRVLQVAGVAGVAGRVGRPAAAGRWRELAGWLAFAWMGWSVFTVNIIEPWYYKGGLVAFALATVVVIWAVTGDATGPLARLVALPPLRWLGVVSYGVYLWHWPIRTYVNYARFDVDRWQLDAMRITLTLAVASASYWLVERPIRRGALRGQLLYVTAAAGLAVTLGIVFVVTTVMP